MKEERSLFYIPMFSVFRVGRTSTDQSVGKRLDGELKKGLRVFEVRKKVEVKDRSREIKLFLFSVQNYLIRIGILL